MVGARRIPLLLGLVGVALVGIGSGCGRATPKLDATTGLVARDRQAALDSMARAADVIGAQFGTRSALGVRVDTTCVPGEKGWPHDDDELYRSQCSVRRTTAYAVDAEPLAALGTLELPLSAVGWRSGAGSANAGWSLTGGRGSVGDLEAFTRLGLGIADLDAVAYAGPRDASLGIRVHPATADIPPPEGALVAQHGLGSYFATTEGLNWQDDWARQRPEHPYVVVVTAFLTFAQQRW